MLNLEQENESRGFMKTSYGDNRLDKSAELSSNMTISEGSKDEFESAIHNVGGTSNGS